MSRLDSNIYLVVGPRGFYWTIHGMISIMQHVIFVLGYFWYDGDYETWECFLDSSWYDEDYAPWYHNHICGGSYYYVYYEYNLRYFRQTNDEGPDAAGEGRLNTRIWTERRQKGRKDRGDGKEALEGKNPGESWRWGEGGDQNQSRTGIQHKLKHRDRV